MRSDIELLDLHRRRGVHDFLYRDAPVEESAARVVQTVCAALRSNPRVPVSLKAAVRFEGQEVKGVIENLSLGGAMVVLPYDKGSKLASHGNRLELEFGLEDVRVRCQGQVRRLNARKALFGKKVVLGLQFLDLDEATRAALARVFELASASQTAGAMTAST